MPVTMYFGGHNRSGDGVSLHRRRYFNEFLSDSPLPRLTPFLLRHKFPLNLVIAKLCGAGRWRVAFQISILVFFDF